MLLLEITSINQSNVHLYEKEICDFFSYLHFSSNIFEKNYLVSKLLPT